MARDLPMVVLERRRAQSQKTRCAMKATQVEVQEVPARFAELLASRQPGRT